MVSLLAMVTDNDKHYILLNEIDAAQNSSQRDLSQRTGLSLGTVNLLLQKMIREGLVKMETIPARRVVYMLTPQGIAEKAKKTLNYIRNHYRIIEDTKKMIRSQLESYHSQYEQILLCLPGNELDDMLCDVIDEYRESFPDRFLEIIEDLDDIPTLPVNGKRTIILYLIADRRTDRLESYYADSMAHASLLDLPN